MTKAACVLRVHELPDGGRVDRYRDAIFDEDHGDHHFTPPKRTATIN
ncbi:MULTISPECIES: hypothetical protein [Streptomyces]|nr:MULTISPECIES: hypothetical protein [Streptomyces]